MQPSEITRTTEGYSFNFTSDLSGRGVIQMVRESIASLQVYARIPGMPGYAKWLGFVANEAGQNPMVCIDLLKGIEVKVVSPSRILLCKMILPSGSITDVQPDNDQRIFAQNGEAILTEDNFALCQG